MSERRILTSTDKAVIDQEISKISEENAKLEKQCYMISELPIYMPKADGTGNPFGCVEILDVWNYGLVSAYNSTQLYALDPASLRLEKLMEADNGNGNPNWYCGKILSRWSTYDHLVLWDARSKKVFLITTNSVVKKSFADQKLGWLRNTGIDSGVTTSHVHKFVVIYAEYYLETYGVDTDVVKVWRSADLGQTWTNVFEQRCRHNAEGGEVYHFHFVRHDPYNDGHWYLGSGDTPDESNIWRSVDDGLTWTKINDPLFSGELQSVHRTCNLYFTEDYIYWGTDDSVTAYGTGNGGKWCRSPRNLDTNQLSIEVLAELGDWVRVTEKTPYGVFIGTERRFSDRSFAWFAPNEDLDHPRLIARPNHTFGNQITNASFGSRMFFSEPVARNPAIVAETRTHVIDLSLMSRS